MPEALTRAIEASARCLEHDAQTIDRAHVEAAHLAFGPFAVPLLPWLASRARAARPELEGDLLVAPADAQLISPVESWEQRLASLLRLDAPSVVVDDARRRLARARDGTDQLEWERVHTWPAPEVFTGTIAFGEIARTLAAHALPPLLDAPRAHEILGAIDHAIDTLVLDGSSLALRHALEENAGREGDPRRARGLQLAVRFLDELGHTDLRTNQDTLVDDCHFALARHDRHDEADAVYRLWLFEAVPRAWHRVGAARSA
jgi:hypothetical protein